MNECALGILLALLAKKPAPLPEARDVPDEERPPLNAALGGPGLDIATADGRYGCTYGFAGSSPYVDVAGARMLRELDDELAAACIALRLAEARSGVRDMLRAEGIEERVGYFGRRVSVDDVLESFFAPREDGREPSRP